jgi:hypothetical protein
LSLRQPTSGVMADMPGVTEVVMPGTGETVPAATILAVRSGRSGGNP